MAKRNVQNVNRIVIVIGILAMVSSVYQAINGAPFMSYFFGLLIGFTLTGTAYINNREWKKNNNS